MPSNALAPTDRARRSGRIAVGILGLACSAIYLFEGRGLRLGTMAAPGPGVFPLVVGILFALVSLAVVIQAWRGRDEGKASFPAGADLRRLLIMALAFLAYVGLLTFLGFTLSSALFVAFYCRVVGRVSWLLSLAAGVGVSITVWLIFGFLLEVRLPTAFWS